MKDSSKSKGFTLLEMLLSVASLAIVVLLLVFWVPQSFHFSQLWVRSDTLNLSVLMEDILRVGTLAKTCVSDHQLGKLVCQVDLAVPPRGVFTTLQFLYQPGKGIVYQRSADGGINFTTVNTYPGISGFEICNDADMTGASPLCTLQPIQISSLHINYSSAPNSYFRFVVQTQVGDKTYSLQSGFFARNSTPLNGLVYQWGELR